MILRPSNSVIRSPVLNPALTAGRPVTSRTSAPSRGAASVVDTPRNARSILPSALSCGTTDLTVSIGTAKPTPELASVPLVAIWELTPITRPSSSSSGPPELPGLMAASVWMMPEIVKPLGAWISRPSADTMPLVTVPWSPNGLPMAIAGSPGTRSLESASWSGLTPPSTLLASTSSSAMSVEGSTPTTLAAIGSPSSVKRTETLRAPSTTWSLVTMWPSVSTTKPEPEAWPWAVREAM